MPAYNAEKFLEPALVSLLAQDYERYEIVVCDDGSEDRTAEILRSFPTVRTVHQPNSGRAAACNAAIAASSGEFVATFDADDLWPPNRLRIQAEYLLSHPNVGCVLGRQEWIDPPPWLGRDPVYGDLDGIPLVSTMFRRAILDDIGGFDPTFRYSEDSDLLVRLRAKGIEMYIIPEILVYRRFHGDNMIADPPSTSPLLRSLRQKLERERDPYEQGASGPE